MDPFSGFLFILTGIYFLVKFIYSAAILSSPRSKKFRRDRKISILVAARNEEENIGKCLESLASLDYPADNFEVLIGDDGSDDRTAEIANTFAAGRYHFKYYRIENSISNIRGKQNVLAQLAKKASGELILVTDADVIVSPSWAARLVAETGEGTVLASGVTLVGGKGFFARMQSLDWLLGFALNKAHDRFGSPITAAGNNMAFDKGEYEKAGGYENLGFSIAEDYLLFRAIGGIRGEKFRQLFDAESLNLTAPAKTFREWIMQRRRWFAGAKGLPARNVIPMIFNAMIVPFILSGFVFAGPRETAIALAVKAGADFLFLSVAAFGLRKRNLLIWFPAFELFYLFSVLIFPFLKFSLAGIRWKGRMYDSKGMA